MLFSSVAPSFRKALGEGLSSQSTPPEILSRREPLPDSLTSVRSVPSIEIETSQVTSRPPQLPLHPPFPACFHRHPNHRSRSPQTARLYMVSTLLPRSKPSYRSVS